jgi:hypothetical protein
MQDNNQQISDVDVDVDVKINNEFVSIDFVVNKGVDVWNFIEQEKKNNVDEKKILEKVIQCYRPFISSYPVVVRLMLSGEYSTRAFKKFLIKCGRMEIKSREQFLRMQIEYIIIMYKINNPHPDEKFIKNYRSELISNILNDDKEFMKLNEMAEKIYSKNREDIINQRRQTIYKYLQSMKQ